jgi:hypothetical protein
VPAGPCSCVLQPVVPNVGGSASYARGCCRVHAHLKHKPVGVLNMTLSKYFKKYMQSQHGDIVSGGAYVMLCYVHTTIDQFGLGSA